MAKLRTFVLVYNNKTVSPPLVTIREYAKWMEGTFDETLCHMHLYLPSKKADGTTAFEWHPGTKIGGFFDTHQFKKAELKSWYVPMTGKAIDQLVQHNLADIKDRSIKLKDNPYKFPMLRVYTVNQIEMYVRSNLDNDYYIPNADIMSPKQVVLSKEEMEQLGKPVETKVKKLF